MLAALEADGCWPSLDARARPAISPRRRAYVAAAQAIAAHQGGKAGHPRARRSRPRRRRPALRGARRRPRRSGDALLPLATIATPNLFELSWLSGALPNDADEAAPRARALGPATVVVTSAVADDGSCRDAARRRRERIERASPQARRHPEWRRRSLRRAVPRATCSTAAPARRRSTPVSPTSIACWRPARVATCCSWRRSDRHREKRETAAVRYRTQDFPI